MTDSSTGGFIVPVASPPAPAPLLGNAPDIPTFLQRAVAGITGLAGNLVRQRWQAEPPNIPPDAIAWAAVGIQDNEPDEYPYIVHATDSDGGHDELQRDVVVDVLASFYDLGVSGMADHYVALLRDGIQIQANRDAMRAAGFGLVNTGKPVQVPSLMKQRWLYRVDLTIRLRHRPVRWYPVRDLLSASVEVTSDGAPTTFDTTIIVNSP